MKPLAEGPAFEEFLQKTFYGQRTYVSGDRRRARFSPRIQLTTRDATRADAALFSIEKPVKDGTVSWWFHYHANIDRIILLDTLPTKEVMRYTLLAGDQGYRLHRCQFIPSPTGEIAAMEFHRKDLPLCLPTDLSPSTPEK